MTKDISWIFEFEEETCIMIRTKIESVINSRLLDVMRIKVNIILFFCI